MVASIGAVAAPAQGASYYERDGYYARDDPEHRAGSAWAGRGAEALGLEGPVDPETFRAVLEGEVPDGSGRKLGRIAKDGEIHHRPGRDLTFSASKSVSLAALVGGDARIVDAHDRAVLRVLDWFERHAAETRMKDPETGRMVRAGGQKTVIATFRHDASRNLDPQLHTHSVVANMVQGEDGKWRTMANEGLYRRQKLIGMIYRNELARGLARIGYATEKSHADGRFEIAGVPRDVIKAFSTRRAKIEKAMTERGFGATAENQRLAERAALMTRAQKREVDKAALTAAWTKQADALGFDARALAARAMTRGTLAKNAEPAREAAEWAVSHLAEREAVFSRADLLAAALSWRPGAVSIGAVEKALGGMEKAGTLHPAPALEAGDGMTTDKALGDERETIELMRRGQSRGRPVMRSWMVTARLRGGALTQGQKEAATLILSAKDRVVGVQGYAGTGKTAMLRRVQALAEKRGYRMMGLAPSASAAATLEREAGIESGTLQLFLARHAGAAEGRITKKSERGLRAAFRNTLLVVDEGSLASTVQARDLLRVAGLLRIPRVVLVGDAKQLDAVDAGKPFAQLQRAGMKAAVMKEIMRQRDPGLRAAVEASLAGDVKGAFLKLGSNVAEVKANNLAGAAAARWLALSPEARERTGVMAPSHNLRRFINAHIRERLAREGSIHGPALESRRLVSLGYTNAEKSLAANYAPGDVVAFHRPYKRLGVEKGDEVRVAGVDHGKGVVILEKEGGGTASWKPNEIGGRSGGVEVYREDGIELRAGDRVRWTRNDKRLGLVNSNTAEVTEIRDGRVKFQLEDARKLELVQGDPQLRHLDHAWASTVHAFQGRTVDNVIAAMEANHPHLTTQKSFYVEISRARDRAELVTDDAKALRERLEDATGERLSALDAIGDRPGEAEKTKDTAHHMEWQTSGMEKIRSERGMEI